MADKKRNVQPPENQVLIQRRAWGKRAGTFTMTRDTDPVVVYKDGRKVELDVIDTNGSLPVRVETVGTGFSSYHRGNRPSRVVEGTRFGFIPLSYSVINKK